MEPGCLPYQASLTVQTRHAAAGGDGEDNRNHIEP